MWGVGFGVWGLGCGDWGLGCGVWGVVGGGFWVGAWGGFGGRAWGLGLGEAWGFLIARSGRAKCTPPPSCPTSAQNLLGRCSVLGGGGERESLAKR